MNKSEIITVVENKLKNQLSRKEVGSVVNIFIDTIKEALENNEKISFKGFLLFETKLVKEKSGHSFGKDWLIPSKYVPKVKFSTSFKKMLALNTKG